MFKYLIGIDEAGRGPLAGPVAVGAVSLPWHLQHAFPHVKESKQLNFEEREHWFAIIEKWTKRGDMRFSVSMSTSKTIDQKGLSFAIANALESAIDGLCIAPKQCVVLLDGLLYAPKKYFMQKTIIGGDDREPIIALASIAAKVTRDRHLINIAKKYPQYCFDEHKGYATAKHREVINKFGLCPIHRKSFIHNVAHV